MKVQYTIFSIVGILITIGVYFARTNHDFFQGTYVREDGVIEWLTVLALLSGLALSIIRIKNLSKHKSRIFSMSLFVLAGLFLFGAGEEISWGQRLFGVSSPAFFLENNSQGEINLHNLVVGGKKINKIVFGLSLSIFVCLYFLVIPFLYPKYEKLRSFINKFAIPLPRNIHIIFYLIIAGLAFSTGSPKKGELLELGGCWVFFLTFLYPKNYNDIYLVKKS